MTDLAIVIPVYNEEEIIKTVVEDWVTTLKPLGIKFILKLYNDGSTDSTKEVLSVLKGQYSEFVEVINKPNSGHGPTILKGYLESEDAEWVFQVDSDNEMVAKHFIEFWKIRESYDFIIGKRVGRTSPLFRQLMSFVSFMIVRICYGGKVKDVNAPYRLMRNAVFSPGFKSIPTDTFAPNIIVSGLANKNNTRVKTYDVQFKERETGEVSLGSNVFKLMKISANSLLETISYALFKKSK